MNLAAKITTGVVLVVVGGLVALAVPTVSAVSADVASWAIFHVTEEPTVEVTPAEDDPIGKRMIDELGDGYVYVGNGTAIPNGSPPGARTRPGSTSVG